MSDYDASRGIFDAKPITGTKKAGNFESSENRMALTIARFENKSEVSTEKLLAFLATRALTAVNANSISQNLTLSAAGIAKYSNWHRLGALLERMEQGLFISAIT